MLAAYVEPVKTPLPFEHAAECMRWALEQHTGHTARDEVLALALAKTALETGRWTSIWNANWGNVKAGAEYRGMFTCITLNEVLMRGGKPTIVWFAPEGELSSAPAKDGKLIAAPLPVPDGHPQTRMRAFANEYDGADCYVDFVANGRYSAAWQKLLAGDALGYIHELKLKGYFTADEAVYARGVLSLQKEFLGKLRRESVPKADVEWLMLKSLVPQLQFDLASMIDEAA